MRLKANLTPDDADGLAFRIKHVGPYDQSIRCEWEGTTDKTPDEVLQASPGGKKTTAGQWLEWYLMGQPGWEAEYRDIIEAGKAAGYGEDALKKAKNRSKNIESSAGTGPGVQGRWQYTLA